MERNKIDNDNGIKFLIDSADCLLKNQNNIGHGSINAYLYKRGLFFMN